MRYVYRLARYSLGRFPRHCTVCGFQGRFFAYGTPLSLGSNVDVLCPNCLSLERHRLLTICHDKVGFVPGRDILHFAPEFGIEKYIRSRSPKSYTTSNYGNVPADLHLDIENMDVKDASFDVIICSHVLEHVDDARALAELYRALRPGGLLIAMVPITEGWDETFEDKSKTKTEDDRILYFNQHDHIRFYGRDFRARLAAPGFKIDEFTATEPQVSLHGLARGEKVFLCSKPAL
jgi:SAM-dependent methyltransferase